jgi:uncharacterized Zn-binding protein involved in type VI secretion
MKSERTVDGAAACRGTGLELAPDVTGNREQNHFSHEGSPLVNQCKNMDVILKPSAPIVTKNVTSRARVYVIDSTKAARFGSCATCCRLLIVNQGAFMVLSVQSALFL